MSITAVDSRNETIPAGMSDAEWKVRCDLAASYRLCALWGWTDLNNTHISARVPGTEDTFLLNPFGLLFDEITASSLIKVDRDGNVLSDSEYGANRAGFVIHSSIHMAVPHLHFVMHSHSRYGTAVSMQKDGLLPVSQKALTVMGWLAYHDYEGPTMRPDEQERLVASLGANKVLILRNHGLLTTGATLEEAFINMFRLQRACEIQVAAQAGGAELTIPSESVCEDAARMADEFLEDTSGDDLGKPEFDAYLRLMDKLDPSYRD